LTINGYTTVPLQAGVGGSGYLGGGKGGSLSGIAVQANNLTANSGAGGAAVAGNGGAGGTISQLFFQGQDPNPAVALTTGAGGFGLVGGAGGNILGRGDAFTADVQGLVGVIAVAGNGGLGITRGGAGGAITNFTSDIFAAGLLDLRAGNGGAAVGGFGGAGGAILSSAPVPLTSLISAPMVVQSGNGGSGLSGGIGGRIVDFVFKPTTPPVNPETVRIVAGNGGSGVTGNGGVGGELNRVTVSAQSIGLLSLYVAGSGGASAGAAGGTGGAITNLDGAAVAGGAMAVAGAGGNGLTVGGAGGAVRQTKVTASGNDAGRAVFMAGQGGDAYGVSEKQIILEGTAPLPAFVRMFSMGSVNGRAGAGGDLLDLTQGGGDKVASDLMAGNGGSLINYGKGSDTKVPVGRGGSVTNVNLAGNAGMINQNALITSYAFDFAEQLRAETITSVNDPGVGNVGVLVGSKGFARNDVGVTGGVTGSVNNFTAANIMSMVAGSVDRVAKITAINNLAVTSGNSAVLGEAKNDPAAPIPPRNPSTTPAYLAPDGVTITRVVQAGGSLIDGAIFTASYTGPLDSLRFFKG
jgi:hypothetical protein